MVARRTYVLRAVGAFEYVGLAEIAGGQFPARHRGGRRWWAADAEAITLVYGGSIVRRGSSTAVAGRPGGDADRYRELVGVYANPSRTTNSRQTGRARGGREGRGDAGVRGNESNAGSQPRRRAPRGEACGAGGGVGFVVHLD